MKYTAEQLEKMSDLEIDVAVHEEVENESWCISPGDIRNKTGGWIFGGKKCEFPDSLPRYCSDWSAIGPLIVEYGIENTFYHAGLFAFASHCRINISSNNKNPLRAICEVILMMGEE